MTKAPADANTGDPTVAGCAQDRTPMTDFDTFPVKPGDWVGSRASRVAKVRRVYRYEGVVLCDLVLFSNKGERTGRESPAMGGPKKFEPACPYAGVWFRITQPVFPLRFVWEPTENGTKIARIFLPARLPERKWTPPARRSASVRNFDPELEAKARIMAAQELRDAARAHNAPALTERAIVLENEASAMRARNNG